MNAILIGWVFNYSNSTVEQSVPWQQGVWKPIPSQRQVELTYCDVEPKCLMLGNRNRKIKTRTKQKDFLPRRNFVHPRLGTADAESKVAAVKKNKFKGSVSKAWSRSQ